MVRYLKFCGVLQGLSFGMIIGIILGILWFDILGVFKDLRFIIGFFLGFP